MSRWILPLTVGLMACSPTPTSTIDDTELASSPFPIAPPPPDDSYQEKASFDDKLDILLSADRAPSAFAGAFLQLARAWESGRAPANDLEADAFAILDAADPEVQDGVVRTLAAVRAHPPTDMERLYDASFLHASADTVVTVDRLAHAVATELHDGLTLGGPIDECRDAERAGAPRVEACFDVDGDVPGLCPRVCEVVTPGLTVRTNGHVPRLSAGQYFDHEVERSCTIDPVTGRDNCEVLTSPDCTGPQVDGTCLAVPTVRRGDSVTLRGYGFFDVDAAVRMRGAQPLDHDELVQAHVCGDVRTPADAPNDCAIADRLRFTVPSVPYGLYNVTVEVPNTADIPEFDRETYTSFFLGQVMLRVVPPDDATYQLVAEELHCIDETGRFDVTGSDEIGIRILTTAISATGEIGPMTDTQAFDLGDVDSGERRDLDRVLFSARVDAGLSLAVVGFEIDNREAYESNVRGFEEAYALILESNWNKIAETLGGLTEAGVTAAGYAEFSKIAGEAVEFGFNAIVALWAPADLVMEDSEGLPSITLGEVTSPGFPLPDVRQRTTYGGIEVTVEPCADTDEEDRPECDASARAQSQYRERRQYRSDSERSAYQLTIRYNRL